MYNPRAINTTSSLMRRLRRLVGMRKPAAGRLGAVGRKKDAVKKQRSWRIKKLSQKALLCLMLPTVIFCLAWLVFTLLLHSDIFRMTAVSVQGNQVTTQQQILNIAGLHRGVNLLTLDSSKIEAKVLEEQWVDQVWVKKLWPSTVEVIIKEYKPFALINLEQNGTRRLYYMNNNGVVFAPSSVERDLDYPVVSGPGLSSDLQGKRFREHSLGAMALDFLQLTAGGNQILPTQAVSEINVDPGRGLIVYLVDHPFPIYMGKDTIRIRFNRLVKVLAKLYREDTIKGVTEIRMDYADNKILVARADEAS